MRKIQLRNGSTIEMPENKFACGPSRICPRCGVRMWRPYIRDGDVISHMDLHGVRVHCPGKQCT